MHRTTSAVHSTVSSCCQHHQLPPSACNRTHRNSSQNITSQHTISTTSHTLQHSTQHSITTSTHSRTTCHSYNHPPHQHISHHYHQDTKVTPTRTPSQSTHALQHVQRSTRHNLLTVMHSHRSIQTSHCQLHLHRTACTTASRQ